MIGIGDYDKNIDKNEEIAAIYYFKKACLVLEATTGTEHPSIAELYVKMGLLYKEMPPEFLRVGFGMKVDSYDEEGQEWLMRGFIVFQGTLGIEHDTTVQAY